MFGYHSHNDVMGGTMFFDVLHFFGHPTRHALGGVWNACIGGVEYSWMGKRGSMYVSFDIIDIILECWCSY